jgi:signal transduction histidine kinase
MDPRVARSRCHRAAQEGRLTQTANGSSGAPAGAPDDLALPRPPGVIRRYFQRHPWLTDSLVALVYLLIAAAFTIVAAVAPDLPPLWAFIVLGTAGTVIVLFRRRSPVLMFALSNVLLIIGSAVGTAAEALLPLLTIYAVSVYRSTRAAWVCFGAGVGAAILAGLVGAIRVPTLFGAPPGASDDFDGTWLNAIISAIVFLLIATLIGTNVGSRQRYVAALLERAEQLARERDTQAEIAGARERERIAREMHDVIAHSLSVMIALAEGARATLPEHPDRAQDAIGRAAETGRRTLDEVRRLLGPVRGTAASRAVERAPQPGIDEVPALVAEFARAGLPVTFTTSGVPTRDPALELTLYRLIQESLTNALRHARQATAVVASLTWSTHSVELVVDNDGLGEAARVGEFGRGIIGMRERVALYGGELQAGPGPSSGWRVRATLPLGSEQP